MLPSACDQARRRRLQARSDALSANHREPSGPPPTEQPEWPDEPEDVLDDWPEEEPDGWPEDEPGD